MSRLPLRQSRRFPLLFFRRRIISAALVSWSVII
eukprot:09310.XXX_134972_135073_1 [CDS] Oithona nana genome sequencing.